jgi:hypothetical protein
VLFDPKSLLEDLTAIHKMNHQVHQLLLPNKSYCAKMSNSGLVINSRDRVVHDGLQPQSPMSNHETMKIAAIRVDRDPLVISIFDRIRHMPTVHPDESFVVLQFGFTQAGGPAIVAKIDGMHIHPRPLTPSHFAKRLVDAERRLSFRPETGRARKWFYGSRTFVAATPEQALWKWLALEQPKSAEKVLATGKANDQLRQLVKRSQLVEVFDMQAALDCLVKGEPSTLL